MTQPGNDIDLAPNMGPTDPAEYDRWFRAKVQAALDDPRPAIPHEQVMAEMDEIIKNRGRAKSAQR